MPGPKPRGARPSPRQTLLKSHAARSGQPFVGPGGYPRPCSAGPVPGCNGDMDRTHQQSELTPRLGRYDIDPEASRITFRTDHLLGLAPVRGTMAVRAGTVTVAEPLAESSVYAE